MYDYRLSSDQFWRLTWAQFEALGKRHDERNRRADYSVGIVASAAMNGPGARKKGTKKPFSPEDFVPQYGPEKQVSGQELKTRWELEVVPVIEAFNRRVGDG